MSGTSKPTGHMVGLRLIVKPGNPGTTRILQTAIPMAAANVMAKKENDHE